MSEIHFIECHSFALAAFSGYDNGDCIFVSESTLCPSCGMNHSDSFLGNGFCDAFLLHSECCFDLGDCGCPFCHEPEVANKVGDDICDWELSTDIDCCLDGGDCLCFQLSGDGQCCHENETFCFPQNSVCPTCGPYKSSRWLNNLQCDEELIGNEKCCFDESDCSFANATMQLRSIEYFFYQKDILLF